ncbi:DeoR family transcriptional regulator [Spirosoma telluris]|uniref:DeoR family transcriptional regulator n=1 Tax=Spirosoma telluris TaxID=2183553 RepID=UPI002FC28AE4
MSIAFLKDERKDLIINQLNLHTRINLTDLAVTLNVSEDTVRRDINDLADEGKLIKIRGGPCRRLIIIRRSCRKPMPIRANGSLARRR